MARATLLLALLLPLVAAHYNLKYPMPYNRIDCNPPDCMGPCPPIWKRGNAAARNSPSNPSAVWRRGETVTIDWHRNNHEGGFYRRSLVPVKHMNSKAWHKKTAFDWGCWTQGRFRCGKAPACGTDKKGFAYRNQMRVPNVFPDGDYVFAMVWYGGVHFRRKRGFFSDYYTCAYVKIKGGVLQNSHKPTYTPGRSHRRVPAGKCITSKRFIGQCGGQECGGKTFFDVPGVFGGGQSPPNVNLRDLGGGAVVSESRSEETLRVAPDNGRRAQQDARREEVRDNRMAQEENAMRREENAPMETRKGPPTLPVRRQSPNRNNHSNHNRNANRNQNRNANRRRNSTQKRNSNKRWNRNRHQNRNKNRKWNNQRNRNRGGSPPSWPSGSWKERGSPTYMRKKRQWYARLNYCRRNKHIRNCYRGQ